MSDTNGHVVPHPTREERVEVGLAARRATPIAALAEVSPDDGRDPLALLRKQAETRIPQLI